MFINFSNHVSTLWDENQLNEAHKYGEIIDVQFPNVSPTSDEEYISALADEYIKRICGVNNRIAAVMVQGEYNLSFEVVNRLLKKGIKVVSACTERMVEETIDINGETMKESRFRFVRFREYRNTCVGQKF